ncbi:MAG TPA: TonB-dependent receptor plug domain-containing protein, partial [Woeseiaceae bacterium]|nr:TonB-dependent receptor plug domain-containing protein [Woeseiaceae bacterium]
MKAEICRSRLHAGGHNAMKEHTIRRFAPACVVASVFVAIASPARAQQAAEDPDQIDEITVVADRVGLLRDRETDSMFGVNRSLVETPRSISIVSEVTMDRYSIETIDDFITTTPGTYGGSFFGVPGAISVRGRRGENYFRGFKRITNNGFFPLPVGASSRVEIIRGPTPVLYGAGRVGGLLNFYPKTVAGENISSADSVQGYAEYTVGSYSKNNIAAQLSAPFELGGRQAGLSLYGEFEDSESFYRGREPEQQILQASFNSDLGNGFSLELGGMYYSSDGYNQTPGWNRLTQDLVDNGTYITGRDNFVSDLGGTGFLSRSDVDAAAGTFFGVSQITQFLEFFFGLPAGGEPFNLDEGVGTTQLSRRNVVLSPLDIWESDGVLVYGDLAKEFDDGSTLKFQLFFDQQDADGSLTTGFAAVHEMDVFEARLSWNKQFELSDFVGLDFYTMLSHREYESVLKENFLQGYVVLDRIDLSVGATPNDIMSNPFIDPNTPWESDFDTTWESTALAVVTDFNFGDGWSLLLNGRYDDYSARGIDNGTFSFGPLGVLETTSEDDFSWSASLSYAAPQ